MELTKRSYKILKWSNRILAALIIVFGLPFYFGYGNPLPFVDPSYSLWDNTWLSVFPIMFIGLGLGWKWPKIGGYLIVVPIFFGFIMGVVIRAGISVHMIIPFLVGTFYLILGYVKVR